MADPVSAALAARVNSIYLTPGKTRASGFHPALGRSGGPLLDRLRDPAVVIDLSEQAINRAEALEPVDGDRDHRNGRGAGAVPGNTPVGEGDGVVFVGAVEGALALAGSEFVAGSGVRLETGDALHAATGHREAPLVRADRPEYVPAGSVIDIRI